MTSQRKEDGGPGTEVVLGAAVLEQFVQMVTIVPDVVSGGMDNILAQIFDAEDLESLDAPWTDSERGLPLGVPLIIQSIAKAPSEYGAGLPFYLEIQAADLVTGEVQTFTSGAVSVVAQLVRAYTLEAFPWTCKLVEATKASKSGNYPQHLESIENTAKPARAGRRG